MEFAISVLGYVLLWAATDVGRKDGKEIKFMRGKWWLIFGLITTGAYIIKNSESWFYMHHNVLQLHVCCVKTQNHLSV